jgi:outer membrane murein-binding lipoprotein Lpp
MLGRPVKRRLAAVVVASALLGGCGSESRTTDEAGTSRSSDYDQSAALVREYVEAISAGDVDAAIALRCRAARPAAKLTEEFAGELQRLEQMIGSIDGVETRPVSSPLVPLEAVPDPIHVGYRVVVDGDVTDEMVTVTVVEDGERRLCGHATAVSQTWAESLSSQFAPQPATSADLVDLMPDAAPPGLVLYEDREVPVDQLSEPRPGLVKYWIRTWRRGSGGGARASVEAYRFDTEQHAIDTAHSLLGQTRADGVAMFSVPDVPGGVGFRVMGWSWLYVQPPNLGPMFDSVTVVYGTTVVVIKVSDDTDGHEAVSALARSVNVAATTGW